LPLESIKAVGCRRDWLFQNYLRLTMISGDEFDLAMEKDIAAPLEQAINSTRRGRKA